MNNNFLYLIIFILFSATFQAEAQSNFRKYSNEFLKIGVGGKYLGMGGALATGENDASAVFYNPAAIANTEHTTAAVMHTSYFAGIANFDYAGVVMPLKNEQTVGLSLIRFGIDNIPNTIELYNPDNTINYDNIKSFSVADYALFFTYAKKMNQINGLQIGGNAKIIHRSYGSFATAWGFGLDASAQITKENYRIGLFLQDITTSFNAWRFNFTEKEKQVFASTNNDIPSTSIELTAPSIHFGGAYKFLLNQGNISIEPNIKFTAYTDQRNVLISTKAASIDMAFGAEIGFWKTAFLRTGIYNFTKATNDLGESYISFMPSLGVGLNIQNLQINYSYNNVANAGVGLYSHVVSASYTFKK
jgi:hypothetical protein